MDNVFILTIVVVVYLLMISYLGYYGYRKTKNALDYLVAGRSVHPFVMALSYGATFISTSAIVGFGGAAAMFGMGLLWLTFLNILMGIIIAFIIFGKRTRKIGHNLDAHTFPELMGRRFQSSFIQGFSGLVIFIFMPLYAAAVLIGAARFIETTFSSQINYNVAILIYTLIICAYVLAGGLKGVMYTDALQGAIMFVGMMILLVMTYTKLGGVVAAHQALGAMAAQVPEKLIAIGHMGWTKMPTLGSNLWWTLVSTIVMGVGIGVLAQPQLAVRFMTVKSNKEINRAVSIGGVFILSMTGIAFVVGALTNVYFFTHPEFGKISMAVAGGNIDKIIPMYINSALPVWFVYVFMLTLLSAAMSTSSSQFHTMGTAIGRDFVERALLRGKYPQYTVLVTRIGIIFGVIATVILGYKLPGSVIAVATAIFFGLCASAFLPSYIGALFWKGMTKAGVIASMLTGFLGTAFWLLFIHQKEAEAMGLCKLIFGKSTLTGFPWTVVDPIVVILPISLVVAFGVSFFTQKLPKEHIEKCFKHV
ncbi:MAG TPA: sodium:solute symporter family protein [Candidatus Omnitrophota bacterium]|nr:sodium:solute symporter family protein [Candidatus Omnitrophota bacterium]HPD84267.1 sodium:solute symporter family protein [Candidatus Omnitrophota bacterium]HRZ03123.1 sodium:solute symporter family protein [Candidatus Omnitrophota bacterium]